MKRITYEVTDTVQPLERKCRGCNWDVYVLYRFEDEPLDCGLCAECFMERLIAEQEEDNGRSESGV